MGTGINGEGTPDLLVGMPRRVGGEVVAYSGEDGSRLLVRSGDGRRASLTTCVHGRRHLVEKTPPGPARVRVRVPRESVFECPAPS